MPYRLALAAALLLTAGSASAQTLPALYAEAGGPTGLYAVGLEQLLSRSGDDARRLSVRAGVSHRTGTAYDEDVTSLPLALEASFALGRPLGLATRFEFATGVTFSLRSSEELRALRDDGTSFAPDFYNMVGVRVEPSRHLAIRAGLGTGEASTAFGYGARPVLGVSARL